MNTTISAELQAFINTHLVDAKPYCHIEAQILEHYYKAVVANGFKICKVWDTEEFTFIKDNDVYATLDVIFSTDITNVYLNKDKYNVTQCMIIGEGEAQTIASEEGDEGTLIELNKLWENAVKEVAPDLYAEYFADEASPF